MGDPTAQRIWDAALGQLQIHVTKPNYDTWLKDTQGLRYGDGQFVVGVPTEFVKEWLGTRMRTVVSQTVGGILGQSTDIAFEIIGRNGNGNGYSPMPVEQLPLNGEAAHAIISSPVPRQRLNPRYTFRSFVIADSNRMSAAAALAAAERPGEDYNPLFIYSSPGLGKTHLLQAIAHKALETGRDALYITAEKDVFDDFNAGLKIVFRFK